MTRILTLYTDASVSTQAAGLAVVVMRGPEWVAESWERRSVTLSSNDAEVAAISLALRRYDERPVVVATDSSYALARVGGTMEGVAVALVDGHAGSFGNCRADHLAGCARRGEEPVAIEVWRSRWRDGGGRGKATREPWWHGWTPEAVDEWARRGGRT